MVVGWNEYQTHIRSSGVFKGHSAEVKISSAVNSSSSSSTLTAQFQRVT
jgi:hypothetical protein